MVLVREPITNQVIIVMFVALWQWKKLFDQGKKPLKLAIDYLDEIGFTCYWAGHGELWRINGCWQSHYEGTFWSNVACANRRLAPLLLEEMENLFLHTLKATLVPESRIDETKFQNHNAYRYDSVTLIDSDKVEVYKLTIVDNHLSKVTVIDHATCVLLDPSTETRPDRRGDLQALASTINCIRLIAVDKKPEGAGQETVEKDLAATIQTLSQNGLFLGRDKANPKVHFFYRGAGTR